MLPEQLPDPVASNPPNPVASKKIVRVSDARLLLFLVALLIIIGGVIGVVGVTMDHQNRMHASATTTAGKATFQAMNNATYTAAVATSQAISGATATAFVSATTIAQANPYPPYLSGNGTLAFVDPLNQPDDHWDNHSDSHGGAAQFTQGAYHVSESQPDEDFFGYTSEYFSNFAIEVQMTITSGDCGGILFRLDDSTGDGYFFDVCQNGYYELVPLQNHSGNNTLKGGFSAAIHTGYNQLNVIAVVANGSNIDLYVNSQQIDNINDTIYDSGLIALCAGDVSSPTEVVYSNARVWTL